MLDFFYPRIVDENHKPMSITLAEARTKIRKLVDDPEVDSNARFAASEIDDAIERATTLIGQQLAQRHQDGLRQITQVSLANGQATIPANSGIIAVFFVSGEYTYKISKSSLSAKSRNSPTQSGTLEIHYYGKNAFPATDNDNITYLGVDLDDALLDQWMVYVAASDIISKDARFSEAIEKKLPQLEAAVLNRDSVSIQSVSSSLNLTNYRELRWALTGLTTLKVFQ